MSGARLLAVVIMLTLAAGAEAQFVYHPITPCRLYDSRLSTPLVGAATRSLPVAGLCGVPNGATAVFLTVAAHAATSPGNLTVFDARFPMPPFPSHYFRAGESISGSTIVTIPDDGPANDLTVAASLALPADQVHFTLDVAGYFGASAAALSTRVSMSASPASKSAVTSLSDGGCRELSSVTVTAPADGQVLIDARARLVADHAAGTLDRFAMQIETDGTVSCGAGSDSIDASDAEVSAGLGSKPDVERKLAHTRVFTQAAGTTVTYRLTGRMLSGASAGDLVRDGAIVATFVPR